MFSGAIMDTLAPIVFLESSLGMPAVYASRRLDSSILFFQTSKWPVQ